MTAPKLPPMQSFHDLLREAENIVQNKAVWKRFIDGTPLSNDVPIWMVAFAQETARAYALAAYRNGLEDAARVCEEDLPKSAAERGSWADYWCASYAEAIRELMKDAK